MVFAALSAKWKEPPRDALDTLVLNAADLTVCDLYTQQEFVPFDPSTKRTEATVTGPDGVTFKVTKGAPQVILALCCPENYDQVAVSVKSKVNEFGVRGIRSLAVARTNDAGDFEFAGILTFLDPPRPDSKATIAAARQCGVDVKMITGDQVLLLFQVIHSRGWRICDTVMHNFVHT